MPIRINATKTRTTDGSTNTTKPRSFNRNSFKGGRRNFYRGKRTATTFEERNSLAAYIAQAQAAPKQPKKSADGWTTMASKKHITMRTPARHRQMIQRSQNQFATLSQPEKKRVVVALPTVMAYKAPTGVWGKPLADAVKEDREFDVDDGEIVEENDMTQLGPLQPYDMTEKNWGDMAMDDEEDDDEEAPYDRQMYLANDRYASMVDAEEDNSAW